MTDAHQPNPVFHKALTLSRCDRIMSAATLEDQGFRLLSLGRFEAALEGIETL